MCECVSVGAGALQYRVLHHLEGEIRELPWCPPKRESLTFDDKMNFEEIQL